MVAKKRKTTLLVIYLIYDHLYLYKFDHYDNRGAHFKKNCEIEYTFCIMFHENSKHDFFSRLHTLRQALLDLPGQFC